MDGGGGVDVGGGTSVSDLGLSEKISQNCSGAAVVYILALTHLPVTGRLNFHVTVLLHRE